LDDYIANYLLKPGNETGAKMVRGRSSLYIIFALMFVLASCGDTSATQQRTNVQSSVTVIQNISTPTISLSPTPSPTANPPSFQLKHIFYIMMENHDASQIFGNTADAPYLNQLANSYGIATRFFGVTHPSLPNYLAAISGDFQGVFDDCTAGANVVCSGVAHLFGGQTLVDQLEAHKMSWKAYMQSLPAPGFTGGYAGLYGQKHDPFMYFATIRNNPTRMQRIVPFTQLNADIASGTLPNFVWITPDVCNDMHGASGSGIAGCGTYDGLIALGDAFVHTLVQQIMHSSAWSDGATIVIAWDEGNSSDGCCKSPAGDGGGNVPLIVITSQGLHHIVLSSAAYNHYSLLGTIEQVWGLGCLAHTCGMGRSALLLPLFE
jgi:phosphatidylinositol-3-phosphatase